MNIHLFSNNQQARTGYQLQLIRAVMVFVLFTHHHHISKNFIRYFHISRVIANVSDSAISQWVTHGDSWCQIYFVLQQSNIWDLYRKCRIFVNLSSQRNYFKTSYDLKLQKNIFNRIKEPDNVWEASYGLVGFWTNQRLHCTLANFFLRISAKILSISKNFCQNSTPQSA